MQRAHRTLAILAIRVCAILMLALAVAALPQSLQHNAAAQSADFDLRAALAAAQPGDTITVPAGTYAGPLLLDRPVTLIGEGMPIIQGTGRGNVVEVTAPNVTLRGFLIRGSGVSLDQESSGIVAFAPGLVVENNRLEDVLFGVYLKNAPNSVIRNNVVLSKPLDLARRGDGIRAWYSEHVLIEDNHVIGSRDLIVWFSPHAVARHNLVEESRYGLHFMFSDDAQIERNILRRNSVGVYVMYGRNLSLIENVVIGNRGPSGYGFGLKDSDNILAEGNRSIANRVGLYIDNSPREPGATVTFRENLLAYNEIGITMLPLVQRNTFTRNIFQDNTEQVAVAGGGDLSANNWSDGSYGNYWSDYRGFDTQGDAIGDLPYQAQSLYEDLLAGYPELRIFHASPAVAAIDLAARAFPIFQPRPKLVDPQPLTIAPALPPVEGLEHESFTAGIAIAAGMLILAATLLALGLHTERVPR